MKKPTPLVALLLVIGLGLLFRLPVLINPERMNSDHAFLGLQALHLFDGAWRWFLWMSDYQGIWEPLVAAAYFKIFGISYTTLQWVPLSAWIFLVAMFFSIARHELGQGKAFLLSLVWVFVSRPFIDTNVLPYRQWSVLFPLLSVFLFYHWGRKAGVTFICGLLPFFALYVDFFSIQFLLPVAGLLFFTSDKKKELALGALCGSLLLLLSRYGGPQSGAPLAFAPSTVLHNFTLFFQGCLPVLLGFEFPKTDTGLVTLEGWVNRYLLFSTGTLFLCLSVGLWRAFSRQEMPLWTRRMGLFGTAVMLNSAIGFLGSSMASSIHSVRYLTPFVFGIPFALMPAFWKVRTRTVFISLTPFLFGIGVGGWHQYGPLVQGIRPVRDPGSWVATANEMGEWIRGQKVRYGWSEYWVSYQLTFLYQENPTIIPEDVFNRYPTYSERADHETTLVQVFTPKDDMFRDVEFLKKHEGKITGRWSKNNFRAYLYVVR